MYPRFTSLELRSAETGPERISDGSLVNSMCPSIHGEFIRYVTAKDFSDTWRETEGMIFVKFTEGRRKRGDRLRFFLSKNYPTIELSFGLSIRKYCRLFFAVKIVVLRAR